MREAAKLRSINLESKFLLKTTINTKLENNLKINIPCEATDLELGERFKILIN